MENEPGQKSFFEQLSPKSALTVGLVGGFMGLCTIGFFVLLGIWLVGSRNYTQGYEPAPLAAAPNNADQQGNQPSAPSQPINVATGHFPARGSASAPVTVIEFADFRCPFCERFFSDAEAGVMRDYVATGKVKYYFRNYAFLGPGSTLSAVGAECANEQGKFWVYHDWMFNNQASESDTEYYSQDNLVKYAGQMGLNANAFGKCLSSGKYTSAVSAELQAGQQAGVNGTPTTFVNGVALVGAQPYSAVKAAIDQALQK